MSQVDTAPSEAALAAFVAAPQEERDAALGALRAAQAAENGSYTSARSGAAHSHPDNVAVHVVTVTHTGVNPATGQPCNESQSFTVPDDYDGRVRIVLVCRRCGEHFETEGKKPHEIQASGVLPTINCGNCGKPQTVTAAEFACTECGTPNRLILATDTGRGASTGSTV